MNNYTDKIVVVQLSSGTQLISAVKGDIDGEALIFDYPFELSVVTDLTGQTKLYVNRYLPYAKDAEVIVAINNIESVAIASDIYKSFYEQKVTQFKALSSKKLDETDSMYDDSYGYGDDEDHEEDPDDLYGNPLFHKGNTTSH
jgi:hypothetical protein